MDFPRLRKMIFSKAVFFLENLHFRWLTSPEFSLLTTENLDFRWLTSRFLAPLNHRNLRFEILNAETKINDSSKFISQK